MQHNEQRWAQCKIKMMGEQIRAESESAWKLQKSARNRRMRIDGFEKEAVRMWEERDQLKEKDTVGWKPRGLTSEGRR